MKQFVDYDKTVFDNVIVYWCVTCKFNRIMNLDSTRTVEMFHRNILLKYEVTLLPNMMKYINP